MGPEGVVIPSTGADRFDMIALYLIHPVICKHLMTILPCTNFEARPDVEGEIQFYMYDTYRHTTDLNLVCYEGMHMWYSLLSIVGLVIWGLGIPLSFYIKLRLVENHLRNPAIRRRYGCTGCTIRSLIYVFRIPKSREEWPHFGGPVLVRIEADFCKWNLLVLTFFPPGTQVSLNL